MSDTELYPFLAECAVKVSVIILNICVAPMTLPSSCRRVGGEIATRLHLIHSYLESFPPYLVDPDIEKQSQNLFENLAKICVWPRRFQSLQGTRNRQCYDCIISLLNKPALRTSLITLFSEEKNKSRLEEFNGDCLGLYKLILGNDDDAEGLPDSFQNRDQDDLPAHFKKSLLNALHRYSQCDPSLHEMPAGDQACQDLRHPARLCLMNDPVSLDILMASRDMALWQEFRFNTQTQSQPLANYQLLAQGGFCELLERQLAARIVLGFEPRRGFYVLNEAQRLDQDFRAGRGESLSSVLRSYQFNPKDKVALSFAVARVYWQFYDSELVHTKWTSETIWFMPEDNGSGPKDGLPLRSYLTFPFGIPSNPVQDVLYDNFVVHRCPRIFAIGKLLLEIGLSEPVGAGICKDQVRQMNLDHRIATSELRRLQSMNWDGFSKKTFFDKAVAYCLDSNNFMPHSEQPQSVVPDTMKHVSGHMGASRDELTARRKRFYRHVVRPLAWLAQKGFGTQPQQVTYISKRTVSPANGQPTDLQIQPEPIFHGGTDVAGKWLQDLNTISAYVQRLRRRQQINIPIRVAILDTGFDSTLPEFKKDNNKLNYITHMRDFVDLDCPSKMTDTFGHGTFMTKLIMECAPLAEIIVARVAKNAKELYRSQDNIAEAIRWAAMECKANVVSMSFGFPADHESISNAIHTVQSNRNGSVIFLSSAGNSPTDDVSFPARHPSVISVYATNCYGSFAESNAIADSKVLGTFGDQIPDDIFHEFRTKFPGVCQPGSSVATAVAAGISATMLAYITVIPSLLKIPCIPDDVLKRKLQLLWGSKGMEALFYKMALNKHNHRWWVNPIWFWKNKESDFSRCAAIYDCL